MTENLNRNPGPPEEDGRSRGFSVINRTFGTRPLVIHAHGPLKQKPAWLPIKTAFFAQAPRRVGATPELTIFTCNNGNAEMGLFERSARHLGLSYDVRGQGIEVWVNSIHKPLCIAAALADVTTEFVLYTDSRDAIIIDDPALAIRRFRESFQCDLLFGGDRINWPALPRFREFENRIPGARQTEFRYLNGGAWLGRTAFCREFFAAALATPPLPEAPDSEQGILKTLFQTYHPRVQLDYRCEIFQNIGFLFQNIFDIEPAGT